MSTHGYWGKRTATIDWCESNYEITDYIAEFWNTISNLLMILMPLYAIYWSYKHKKFAQRNKWSQTFIIPMTTIYCQIALFLVGCGSWMFHMTLLYPMQLLDELPMLYCAAFMIYANYDLIISIRKLEENNSKSVFKPKTILMKLFETRSIIFGLSVVYCALCTFIYLSIWKNPIFHEVANGVQVFFIIVTSLYIATKFKSSTRLLKICSFYYFLGFFFWNLDNHFCSYLQSCRNFLDDTFGIDGSSGFTSIVFNAFIVCLKSLFEFHSIWHISTGFGSYSVILFIVEGNYQLHLKQTNDKTEKRVIASKYKEMYYHLTNEIIETVKEN